VTRRPRQHLPVATYELPDGSEAEVLLGPDSRWRVLVHEAEVRRPDGSLAWLSSALFGPFATQEDAEQRVELLAQQRVVA